MISTVINIYTTLFRAGLFKEYVKNVFCIWTFALRWKKKNYNKVPLIFLSDVFYWKYNGYSFFEILQRYLLYFNEYYIKNTYSKIRVNTLPNTTIENIIK